MMPAADPAADSRDAARAERSQRTDSSPKPARKNSPDHLVPTARPRHTPGGEPPPADSQPRARQQLRCGRPAVRAGSGRLPSRAASLRSAVVAVHQQGPEGSQDPEHQEDIQQRCPGHHQVVAVDGEQQPGRRRQRQRAEQLLRDQGEQQDGQGAGQRRARSASRRGCPAPKSHIPPAIIHLPTGGWTTYSGVSRRMSGFPALKESLALSGQLRS